MDNCGHKFCSCVSTTLSVHQTLDELDFQRGIWAAALDGDVDKIKTHLQKEKNVNAKDSSGYSALHYSSRSGHYAACKLLLEKGACANAQTPGLATPLHRASLQGHSQVVELLLRYGADPGVIDSDGKNSLHKAAEGGHIAICNRLLKYNQNLKIVADNRGLLPVDLIKTHNEELQSLLAPYQIISGSTV